MNQNVENQNFMNERGVLLKERIIEASMNERKEIEIETAAAQGKEDGEGTQLAKLLRVLGSLLLLGAAVAFMIQSWQNMSFALRYSTFLGFTGLLAAAGVYCGVKLQEAKGARSFLGISAAFLPAHFVQLGAMLYYSLYGTPTGLNSFFVVVTQSMTEPLLMLGLALPVLTAVSYFAFSALLRAEARLATIVYVVSNAVLLIPTRDPEQVAILSLLVFGLLAAFEHYRLSGKAIMRSKEGIITRAILAAPYLTLLTRNLVLYHPTALIQCAAFFAATVIAYRISRVLIGSENIREQYVQWIAERASFIGAAFTWAHFANVVVDPRTSAFVLPFTYLPMAAIIAGMSYFVKGDGRGYRRIAAWMAVLAGITQLAAEEGILSSILCLGTCVVVLVTAQSMKERGMFYAGASGLAYSVLYHFKYAAHFYTFSPWLSLAVIGTIVLLSSSYLERYFPQLLAKSRQVKDELAGWK